MISYHIINFAYGLLNHVIAVYELKKRRIRLHTLITYHLDMLRMRVDTIGSSLRVAMQYNLYCVTDRLLASI